MASYMQYYKEGLEHGQTSVLYNGSTSQDSKRNGWGAHSATERHGQRDNRADFNMMRVVSV
ncbi:17546_t:CDS:2, partial [Funneliformis geosporum]